MTPSSTLPAPETRGPRPQPRKSLWIPAVFVGLMLLVVAVNGTMMYFAEHTFSGLDTDAAYQEGIEYNAILKEAAASAALGWTAKAEMQPTQTGRRLDVRIIDRAGHPVEGLDVAVHMVRPTSTAFDRLLALQHAGPGLYAAEVDLPGVGVWDLRLSATGGAAPWQATQRLFVK